MSFFSTTTVPNLITHIKQSLLGISQTKEAQVYRQVFDSRLHGIDFQTKKGAGDVQISFEQKPVKVTFDTHTPSGQKVN